MIALGARQRAMMEALFGDIEPTPPLAIYRRNVLGSLGAALAATYPVVARLVGLAFFAEAARRFALESPSTSGDLTEYGVDFAAFLARYEHARAHPYLPDVARLEWACHRSLHASEAGAFDFAALADVAPERYGELRFTMNPSLYLVRSRHPIAAIWEANQPDRDGTPQRGHGGERVVVWRDASGVRVRPLDEVTWSFLTVLASGRTLAEAIDDAQGLADVAATLTPLVADRILAGFDAAPRA